MKLARRCGLLQFVPHFHEEQAQHVLAFSVDYSPMTADRTVNTRSLDQSSRSRGAEELPKVRVLRKLRSKDIQHTVMFNLRPGRDDLPPVQLMGNSRDQACVGGEKHPFPNR